MRLTCPCCAAHGSIEMFTSDAKARAAVAAALNLPNLGDRILRYLGLFRPRNRGLSWDRVVRLLEDLLADISAAEIERDGRKWPAPLDAWKSAFDDLLDRRDKLDLPLSGHGYLYEIIAAQARRNENRRAERQEVADEQAKARQGTRSGQMQPAAAVLRTPDGAVIDPQTGEILSDKRPERTPPPAEFRALMGALGRKMAMPTTAENLAPHTDETTDNTA